MRHLVIAWLAFVDVRSSLVYAQAAAGKKKAGAEKTPADDGAAKKDAKNDKTAPTISSPMITAVSPPSGCGLTDATVLLSGSNFGDETTGKAVPAKFEIFYSSSAGWESCAKRQQWLSDGLATCTLPSTLPIGVPVKFLVRALEANPGDPKGAKLRASEPSAATYTPHGASTPLDVDVEAPGRGLTHRQVHLSGGYFAATGGAAPQVFLSAGNDICDNVQLLSSRELVCYVRSSIETLERGDFRVLPTGESACIDPAAPITSGLGRR